MSETKEIKRVSQKEIMPYIEVITPLVKAIREEVEKMPKCSKKEALLLSVVAFEKKIAIAVKELSEESVMQYVNKHPELLQKLAEFAASDEGAKKIAQEAIGKAGVDINEQQTEKQKAGKRRH